MSISKMNILTMGEKDTLVECEKLIERGQQTFVEVGLALAKIRDKKLYRIGHATFDAYCQKRWGWSASRARQICGAVEVAKSVTNVTLTSEGAARELGKVAPEKRQEVIELAGSIVGHGGTVTAKVIEQAAAEIQEAELVHRDALGREIPAAVLPLWKAACDVVDELLPLARKLKSAIKLGVEDKEANRVWIDATNGDTSPVQQAINLLTLTIQPHAVCYVCNGHGSKKCKLCKGRGYIGKHLWSTCPEETKKMIEKAK